MGITDHIHICYLPVFLKSSCARRFQHLPKKRACWGIIGTHSGAEGACSKSSAHNDLQGIWSAWFFCLCSSSKSARSCWNATPKNISANSFFRCVHLQQIHARKYTIYFIGTLYVRMQFRNQVGEHQIRTFFPICPRRCTHLWAFAAPANPTQRGLEQKLFPKTGILTVLFVMMTSFMILRLKDCMNLSFSISSLKKTRQSPGFFQIRALSTPSIYSTQQPI